MQSLKVTWLGAEAERLQTEIYKVLSTSQKNSFSKGVRKIQVASSVPYVSLVTFSEDKVLGTLFGSGAKDRIFL